MPTYEYECLKCGKVFDVFQSIKDEPLSVCTCGDGGEVKRKIGTGSGLLFKGSGFYTTDYRSDSYKKSASADKKSAEPAKGSDSKKSDKGSSGSKASDSK